MQKTDALLRRQYLVKTILIIKKSVMSKKANLFTKLAFIVLLIFVVSDCQQIALEKCIEYSLGICARCDYTAHLFQGICYGNILGCLKYKDGSSCSECQEDLFFLNKDICSLKDETVKTEDLMSKLYLYNGNSTNTDPGAQFGEAGFMLTTYDTVKNWPTFIMLNSMIRSGQYKHFISKMSNPIYSVAYYTAGPKYSYKILYYGTGGGLYLCIADVVLKSRPTLRSLVPIASTNVINQCIEYNQYAVCVRCINGYHLENNRCYPNYVACARYLENLCIQCLDYYLLIENRCVSECLSVSDSMGILYYQGNFGPLNNFENAQCTMQSYYNTPIEYFWGGSKRVSSSSSMMAISTETVSIIRTTTTNTSIVNEGSTVITSTECKKQQKYIKSQNKCVKFDPELCGTMSNDDLCATCYPGFKLYEGFCILNQ